VLITAYDLAARRALALGTGADMSMVDAAHASSAAPTYFEPVRAGARTLIDGGVFAVNPAALACTGVTAEIDVLASVGTGQHRPLPFAEVEDWGQLECARPILDVVFDGGHSESRGGAVRIPSVVAHPGQQSAPRLTRSWAWRLSAMR
jgi:predicted acylesterase/phospholipase RssA